MLGFRSDCFAWIAAVAKPTQRKEALHALYIIAALDLSWLGWVRRGPHHSGSGHHDLRDPGSYNFVRVTTHLRGTHATPGTTTVIRTP